MTKQPRDPWGRWSANRLRVPAGTVRAAATAAALIRVTDPRWLSAPPEAKLDGGLSLPGDENVTERKLGPTGAATLSATDWKATVMLSVTGLLDRVGDICVPDCYYDTLKVKTPKIVLYHSWQMPCGKCLEIAELQPGDSSLPSQLPDGRPWPKAAGALVTEVEFNQDTSWGRDGWGNVKFYGPDQEWSIGYNVPKGGSSKRADGVRLLEQLELLEGSEVLWGAMPSARTLTVAGS